MFYNNSYLARVHLVVMLVLSTGILCLQLYQLDILCLYASSWRFRYWNKKFGRQKQTAPISFKNIERNNDGPFQVPTVYHQGRHY